MRHATEAEAGGLLRILLVWIRPLPTDPSELILLYGASYGMSPATHMRSARGDLPRRQDHLAGAPASGSPVGEANEVNSADGCNSR